MSRTTSPWRWKSTLVPLLLALATFASQADAAPIVTGSQTYQTVEPRGAATAKNPIKLDLSFPDPADNTKSKTETISVEVAPWPAKVGETKFQASKRKADAVKAAIDAAAAAKIIPASVTAKVDTTQALQWDGITTKAVPNPQWHPHPHGFPSKFNHPHPLPMPVQILEPVLTMQPNAYSKVTYDGVTKTGVIVRADPTRQGGGAGNFTPGKVTPTQPSPGYRPSMGGNGSSSGTSTGLDPLGQQSIISFGFYDDLNETDPDPTLYVVSYLPGAGESEEYIMHVLEGMFNYKFGSSYSLQYNESLRELFVNQELGWNNTFYFGNSDSGLDLNFQMTPVPEPSTLALALASLVCLGTRIRNSVNKRG